MTRRADEVQLRLQPIRFPAKKGLQRRHWITGVGKVDVCVRLPQAAARTGS